MSPPDWAIPKRGAKDHAMRRRGLVLGAVCSAAAWSPATAQPAGGRRTADMARTVFARNIESSLGLPVKSFEVLPSPGLEEIDFQARLKTGSLLAWTAQDREARPLVNGFAGAGPGVEVAFEGFRGGVNRPGGLSALMRQMQFRVPARRPPFEAILDRVAFCLNRVDRAEHLFDENAIRGSGFEPPPVAGAPKIEAEHGLVALRYFTMVQGLTGTFDIWKITVGLDKDYAVTIDREEVGR